MQIIRYTFLLLTLVITLRELNYVIIFSKGILALEWLLTYNKDIIYKEMVALKEKKRLAVSQLIISLARVVAFAIVMFILY